MEIPHRRDPQTGLKLNAFLYAELPPRYCRHLLGLVSECIIVLLRCLQENRAGSGCGK
uniref:Uncharacterized protein n=1 Tax=Anguilla anguilla TaxID=7936 RepID=A0A0E9VD28_ANGAN